MSSDLPRENSATNATTSLSSRNRSSNCRILEIDLRVGEVLFAQPRVHCPDAVRQAIAPIAVGFEAGREFT